MQLQGIQQIADKRNILVDCLAEDRNVEAIIAGQYRGVITAVGSSEQILIQIEPLMAAGIRIVQTTTHSLQQELLPTITNDLDSLLEHLIPIVNAASEVGLVTNSSPLARAIEQILINVTE